MLKRVKKNPSFQNILKRVNSKVKSNLSVIKELDSSSTSSSNDDSNGGIKKKLTWGTVQTNLKNKFDKKTLEKNFDEQEVTKSFALKRKNTWFKVTPNINLTKSKSSEDIFDLLEQTKSAKINEKLQEAIKEIQDAKDMEDEELEINLDFLMSDSNVSEEQLDEAVIADKVVSDVAKPKKTAMIESEQSDGLVKMINGDDANIV